MRLKNKLAVITASASGIGRAGIDLFAREGASVVAVDIQEEQLAKTVEAARRHHPNVHGIVADLTDREQSLSVIDKAVALLGGIDILWNNAGMPGPGEVEEISLAAYDKSIELNVSAGILISGQAIPHMRGRGGGSIVFTSSISGIRGSQLSPTYSAAKFAVTGFAKSLALSVAKDRIRVNAICPGMTQTDMLSTFMSRKHDAQMIERNRAAFVANTPLGRIADPAEIAHAALWLASDDASFVTGIALSVDGGLSAR